ncbi:hypothetical protein Tco_0190559 [Tanacetum coccineum]
MNDESNSLLKEEQRKIASHKKAAPATSTNQLSTARPFVSTGSSSVSTDRSNTPNVSDASTYTDLEDVTELSQKIEISMELMMMMKDGCQWLITTTWKTPLLSAYSTLRIHKDHPKGQILRDPTSAV